MRTFKKKYATSYHSHLFIYIVSEFDMDFDSDSESLMDFAQGGDEENVDMDESYDEKEPTKKSKTTSKISVASSSIGNKIRKMKNLKKLMSRVGESQREAKQLIGCENSSSLSWCYNLVFDFVKNV